MNRLPHQKLLIGLVGGIGSGKSAVARAFATRGGMWISADKIAHEALEQPQITTAVKQNWGPDILLATGAVDRKKLGGIVFADPIERVKLEFLVFPWIETRIREAIAESDANAESRFTVLDAAIMLEVGWNNLCDRLVYIHTPREVRLQRLAQNRGWTPEELIRRERAQLPLAWKAARADAVVDNSGSLEETDAQVGRIVEDLASRER